MKASELIEQLIYLERESSFGDVEVRCSDRSQGIELFPTVIEFVTVLGTGERFFSLEVIKENK